MNPPRWHVIVGCLVVVVAVMLAYRNTLNVPLVFDDTPSLRQNPSLDSFAASLHPPNREGMTVAGRPVLNFSFAVNRAISGESFAAYRVTNIGIHICAALVLLFALRRGIALAASDAPSGWLAAATALLWSLHPLNTESVTYLVQRAESLAGLFYFLSLLGFLNCLGANRSIWGAVLAVASCFLGVATKETVATAPILMLLYDRAFVAGSFAVALKTRWRFYAAAASSWFFLALLVASTGGRGTSAGYDSEASTLDYLATQAPALLTYVKLAFWPTPLVFDYGAEMVDGFGAVVPQAIVCGIALTVTGYLVVRNRAAGFLAGAYLLVLAPTSSFIPVATQAMAEHRTYPANVFLLLLVTIPLGRAMKTWALCVVLPWTLVLGVLTYQRNVVYASALDLWTDTAVKRPTNARAFYWLGGLWMEAGKPREALDAFRQAVELKPAGRDLELNAMGQAQLDLGDIRGAAQAFDAAMKFNPHEAIYPSNLATALSRLGETDAAIEFYRRALVLDPRHGRSLCNLANLLMRRGQHDEAMGLYRRAEVEIPEDPVFQLNYAVALGQRGDRAGEAAHLALALKLAPQDPRVVFASGCHQAAVGNWDDAQRSFVRAIALDPNHLPAHANLGDVYLRRGQTSLAREQYLEVLRLDPQNTMARDALARLDARQPSSR